MSIFIPRKREYWQKKPTGLHQVDRSNKFVGNNTSIASFADGKPRVLDQSDLDLYGTAEESSEGAVLGFDSNFSSTDPSLTMNGYTAHTWAWVGTIHSFDTWGGLIGRTRLNSGSNCFFLQRKSSNDEMVVYINGSPSTTNILTSVTPTLLADGIEHAHCITRNGNAFKWYIDGELKDSLTLSSSSALSDDSDEKLIFGAERGATGTNARSDWVVFQQELGVAWSAEEAADWSANPYQILKPLHSYWLMPAANDGATHNLLADDAESTSEATNPALGQTHNLTASSAESASETTQPALGQIHSLSGDSAESTSQATSPSLGQTHNLLAESGESQSEAVNPVLGQVHALQADSAESSSEATSPVLTEVPAGVVALFADNAESSSEATSPALGQVHALSADSAESSSAASTPALGVVVNLFADDAESTSEATSPVLAMGATALTADSAESASEATTPALAQVHVLYADSAESGSEASRPVLDGVELATPGHRIFTVSVENRIFTAAKGSRSLVA